ncbi:MAG: hypothetical protein FD163_2249 [Hyphomonadaceae bacterium]|nr:MAG: hypothetical protein FD163_2249 [Hyphomonadaceae bacterium]
MPLLENPNHEEFCQLVAGGKSQTEAYIEAGYAVNGARGNASRLIANDSISARILELQSAKLLKNEENARQTMWEINHLIARATKAGQYSAAIRGVAIKMRIIGMI